MVILVILPLFAFANAGVSFDGIDLSMVTSPLLLAISLGLIIGKPLGVFGFSYLSVKLGMQNFHKASTSNKFLP